jgi:DNA-damage-inducible protein J
MTADTVVRARIPTEIKSRAMEALGRMGLSASDLIRMIFMRVADEGRLPFDMAVPNRVTRQAMTDTDAGNGKRFANADKLFEDLGI